MDGYRHVVDGTVQFPLPSDPEERARTYGRVAVAWSRMVSSLEDLMVHSREPCRLVERALKMAPGETNASIAPATNVVQLPVTPPPPKRDRAAAHMAKMRAAKAAKKRQGERGPDKKPRKRRPAHVVAGVPAA